MSELNEKHLELIEKYLIDNLNEDELILFNDELKNEGFRNELLEQARHLDDLDFIVNEDLKTELLNSGTELKNEKPTSRKFSKWLLLGLSIILISLLAYFFKTSEKEPIYLADNYFTPYPPDTNIRGVENTKSFSNAIKFYANADYLQAIEEFKKINPKNENLELYLACSFLKVNNYSDAYNTLNQIPNSPNNPEIQQNRDWFKIISLLGLGNEKQAKSLLQNIINSDTHLFKQKAIQLLKEL